VSGKTAPTRSNPWKKLFQWLENDLPRWLLDPRGIPLSSGSTIFGYYVIQRALFHGSKNDFARHDWIQLPLATVRVHPWFKLRAVEKSSC
jgi:hypothetical protein